MGTVGYMAIAGWGFLDALYMTVVILSTVGLGEAHPLNPTGRVFTIILIVAGVGVATYLVSTIGEYVANGLLTGAFRTRRMQRSIDNLSRHYIVCGFGRVGQQVAADLVRRDCAVVAVEPADTELASGDGIPIVKGDATEDDVLLRAGVARARGLVATTGNNATNLVITLTARALNADLVIVSRASQPETEPKLFRAGASHVVSPYAIGGHRMATQLVAPGISAFLDTLLDANQLDLWLEEAVVAAGSAISGQLIGDALPRTAGAVNLLALRRAADGRFVTNPPADVRLVPGDLLIAVGSREDLKGLMARAAEPASAGLPA